MARSARRPAPLSLGSYTVRAVGSSPDAEGRWLWRLEWYPAGASMISMVVTWTGPRTTRTRACGCVERGRWLESAAPWLRWWSPNSRRPCAAHKNSRSGGGGRTP